MKNLLKVALALPLFCCGCGSLPGNEPPTASGVVEAPQVSGQHPEMANDLVKHLRSKYPDLESHVIKAVCSLDSKYPGLVYSLPRHLLEDLQGEPFEAMQDVAAAERAAYPDMREKIKALRSRQGPRQATAAYMTSHYPGFASKFLAAVDGPGVRSQIRYDAQGVIHEKFPKLPREVLLSVTQEADANFSGLASEVATNHGQERPLRYLAKHHPEFVRAAVACVMAEHGPEIRQALIAVLSKLEQDPAARVAPRVLAALDFVGSSYPSLLPEILDQRMAARQKLRAAIAAQFPEARTIAVQTLLSKHPMLLGKVLTSLQTHYPTLKDDFLTALESELPGIRQETRSYLQANYPDVAPL